MPLPFVNLTLKLLILNNYMFTMITLDSVQNIPYEILTKLTKMHWTCVKQCKTGRNNLNNTYKSGGKVSKKM